VKSILWFVATMIVLVGTYSAPSRIYSDGNPSGGCPNGQKTCKP
jgi:hypothetical protein